MVTPVPYAGVRPRRKASTASAVTGASRTDADFSGCRWIEGDPSPLRPGMFCGLPVSSDESWCEKHRGVVFGENLPAKFVPQGLAGAPAAGWWNRLSVGFSLALSRHEH
jgi:hypothetical protein